MRGHKKGRKTQLNNDTHTHTQTVGWAEMNNFEGNTST